METAIKEMTYKQRKYLSKFVTKASLSVMDETFSIVEASKMIDAFVKAKSFGVDKLCRFEKYDRGSEEHNYLTKTLSEKYPNESSGVDIKGHTLFTKIQLICDDPSKYFYIAEERYFRGSSESADYCSARFTPDLQVVDKISVYDLLFQYGITDSDSFLNYLWSTDFSEVKESISTDE